MHGLIEFLLIAVTLLRPLDSGVWLRQTVTRGPKTSEGVFLWVPVSYQ